VIYSLCHATSVRSRDNTFQVVPIISICVRCRQSHDTHRSNGVFGYLQIGRSEYIQTTARPMPLALQNHHIEIIYGRDSSQSRVEQTLKIMASATDTVVTQVFDLFPHASDITPEGNQSSAITTAFSNLQLQKKRTTDKKCD
jgi:hypothetical protein